MRINFFQNPETTEAPARKPRATLAVLVVTLIGVSAISAAAQSTIVAWGSNNYDVNNVPTNLTNVVAVSTGANYALALREDGTVVGWGFGGVVTTNLSNIVAITTGSDYYLALGRDGRVVSWGDNSYGQSAVPSNLAGVVAISAGYTHSLAEAARPGCPRAGRL